mmetsp:Transcript_21325/g.30553  ORF Transcript_21325/g.30553 Transcript_21325/m.30553 type:complete len:228 (-) Transcript_21325:66-749(-)
MEQTLSLFPLLQVVDSLLPLLYLEAHIPMAIIMQKSQVSIILQQLINLKAWSSVRLMNNLPLLLHAAADTTQIVVQHTQDPLPLSIFSASVFVYFDDSDKFYFTISMQGIPSRIYADQHFLFEHCFFVILHVSIRPNCTNWRFTSSSDHSNSSSGSSTPEWYTPVFSALGIFLFIAGVIVAIRDLRPILRCNTQKLHYSFAHIFVLVNNNVKDLYETISRFLGESVF